MAWFEYATKILKLETLASSRDSLQMPCQWGDFVIRDVRLAIHPQGGFFFSDDPNVICAL